MHYIAAKPSPEPLMADVTHEPKVSFDIAQDDWRSWSLSVDGDVAR